MHICIWTSKLMIFLFTAANFLCQLSQGFWNNKWFTLAASTVYFGSSIIIFTTYFESDLRFVIQNLGVLIQSFGGTIFLGQSYNFLIKHSLDEKLDDGIKADDLFCRFANGCVLFVVFALFLLYIGYGLPAWSECDGPYLTTYTLCLSVPNISMSVAFAMATRNEAFYIQKVKQKFVRYISHEMRTPLNTAVMGLQYLRVQMMKSRAQEELLTIVDEVQSACEITVTILNEMLDYDKLQSGLMKLEKEELNVKDFLENTLSPFYIQARQKDVELTCHFIHSELDTLLIDADKNKLAQVVRNLVSNALKFTPPSGSVQVRASMLQPSERDRVCPIVKLDVIDSGVGVTKDNQQLLFHQIVQFNPGKLQSGGGSGLGLYISKGIMDLHHGSLTIASDGIGHGCTFSITLDAKYDLQLVDDAAAASGNNDRSLRTSNASRRVGGDHRKAYTRVTPSPRGTSPLHDAAGRGRGNRILADYCQSYSDAEAVDPPPLYRVLVVDDSTSNRKMLVRLLRDKCSDISEAVDGVDAVQKISAAVSQRSLGGAVSVSASGSGNQYDVVLMDFIMPNMEGPEAAKRMRALGFSGIIVGITGNVLPADRELFISSGADVVLTKPVHITDIEQALSLSQSQTK